MICRECKRPIETLADTGSNGLCTRCYNDYMREYRKANRVRSNELSRESMRFKRWIAGGENNTDLGPDIKIGLRSINGQLYIKTA